MIDSVLSMAVTVRDLMDRNPHEITHTGGITTVRNIASFTAVDLNGNEFTVDISPKEAVSDASAPWSDRR
jgi:hypothetical protein